MLPSIWTFCIITMPLFPGMKCQAKWGIHHSVFIHSRRYPCKTSCLDVENPELTTTYLLLIIIPPISLHGMCGRQAPEVLPNTLWNRFVSTWFCFTDYNTIHPEWGFFGSRNILQIKFIATFFKKLLPRNQLGEEQAVSCGLDPCQNPSSQVLFTFLKAHSISSSNTYYVNFSLLFLLSTFKSYKKCLCHQKLKLQKKITKYSNCHCLTTWVKHQLFSALKTEGYLL